MSDTEQPRKVPKEKENEQIQSTTKNEENKIQIGKDKSENEEMKVESNKKEVALMINEGTVNREVVGKSKPIMFATYYNFGRNQMNFSPSGPPQDRPDYHALNYKTDHRNDFVRLVLMLVLTMLIATGGFIGMALINDTLKDFFKSTSMLLIYIPSLILIIGVNYAFMCSPCSRKPPCNFVMLFLTTVGMTLIATTISVRYGTEVVFYAVLATAGIVIVCVALACTSFDFTKYMLYIVVIAAAFSMVALIVMLVKLITGIWMKPVIIAILAIGTLIQAVLLVVEIQTVIGGRAVELSEEDYALGAYMIYTSIVNIFLNMVQMIGLLSND